jgi:hypothetical protein
MLRKRFFANFERPVLTRACMQTRATSEPRQVATWQDSLLTAFRNELPSDGIVGSD